MGLGMALLIWLVIATEVGASGLLGQLPMPSLQIILATLTIATLVIIRRPSLRSRINRIPTRTLVLFHCTRLIGLYFLYLYSRGRLPYAFAVPGGGGDIAVALGALIVAIFPMATPFQRRLCFIWNSVGLLDITFVVLTAARLALADPSSMRELTKLPLSLLPTFLVPLIIVSHILIFSRLRMAHRHESLEVWTVSLSSSATTSK